MEILRQCITFLSLFGLLVRIDIRGKINKSYCTGSIHLIQSKYQLKIIMYKEKYVSETELNSEVFM